MVLSNSESERRAFPQDSTLAPVDRAGFRDAVARCLAVGEVDTVAADLLRGSARAARGQRVKPENVVALIRTFWYDVSPTSRPTVDHDPRLITLIGTALDAYFEDVGSGLATKSAQRAD